MTGSVPALTFDDQQLFNKWGGIHPITKQKLEAGFGAAPIRAQAEFHCRWLEQYRGKAVADAMREKLKELGQ